MLIQSLGDGQRRHCRLRRDPFPRRSGARHHLGRVDHPLPGAHPTRLSLCDRLEAPEIAGGSVPHAPPHPPDDALRERAVPLALYYTVDSEFASSWSSGAASQQDFPKPAVKHGASRRGRTAGRRTPEERTRATMDEPLAQRSSHDAQETGLAPGHLFSVQPQRLPGLRRDTSPPFAPGSRSTRIGGPHRAGNRRHSSAVAARGPPSRTRWRRSRAVGAPRHRLHHAGLPILKQLVEMLFTG